MTLVKTTINNEFNINQSQIRLRTLRTIISRPFTQSLDAYYFNKLNIKLDKIYYNLFQAIEDQSLLPLLINM